MIFDSKPWIAATVGALLAWNSLPAQATAISVGPYTASSTGTFIVPIDVSGAVDLDTFTFDVAYNPADYAINTGCDPFSGDAYCDLLTGPVTLGPFYTSGALFPQLFDPGFVLLDDMGNQSGLLTGVNGAWQDPEPAPSGDGILAFIEFVAVDGGSLTSPITVVGEGPTTPPATVPEPPTVLLVGTSIGFLALSRRRRSAAAAR